MSDDAIRAALDRYPTWQEGRAGGSRTGVGSAAFIWRAVGYLVEQGEIDPFARAKAKAETAVSRFAASMDDAPDISRNLQEVGYALSYWRDRLGNAAAVAEASGFDRGYARLRAGFLSFFPGFASFRRDQRYRDEERNYKDDMLSSYRQLVLEPISRGAWAEAGEGFLEFLRRPLASTRKPQNVVGWRYIELIDRLGERGRMQLAEAMADLLDEGSPVAARVDAFITRWKRVAGTTQKILPAAQRSIVGLCLSLAFPERHVFLKTNELRRALRVLDPDFEWTRSGLTGSDVERVDALVGRVHERLEDEGWAPQDRIDVQGFLWVAAAQAWDVEDADEELDENVDESETVVTREPFNQILFGPPGTGKTFATVDRALAILEPEFSGTREDAKRKFDAYVVSGQVRFVTFHQSFSYEDFVEGIRAGTNEDTRQIEYSVEDGVFKQLCTAAGQRVLLSAHAPIDLAGRRIWKISLGQAGVEEGVYDDCIEQGLALVGFGGNADFSGVQSRKDILQRFADAGQAQDTLDYPVTAINTFIRQVQVGDLFVVTEGNLKFRAIGEVTSEYLHVPREDDSYSQARRVNWLRVYEASLPYQELMENRFSQMTIYELRPGSINMDKLAALLAPDEVAGEGAPRVLIIDEINRGNVSRIFGELITLIEPSRRAGMPEQLQVTLPYSKASFSVPKNVYLIGTMNTADRSLATLDVALRRRFAFVEMPPRPDLLQGRVIAGVDLGHLLRVINMRIEALLDRDHAIGHAFFMPLQDGDPLERLAGVFRSQVVPLLQEYFFEDWERIAWVLNDHRKASDEHRFVLSEQPDAALFGVEAEGAPERRLWRLNPEAFDRAESYAGIIGVAKD